MPEDAPALLFPSRVGQGAAECEVHTKCAGTAGVSHPGIVPSMRLCQISSLL